MINAKIIEHFFKISQQFNKLYLFYFENIEFPSSSFESFVSPDELLLKLHVATFNLKKESKKC